MSVPEAVWNGIKALKTQVGKLTDELLNTKFQHAELAAKVDALARNQITEESVENASENWNTCVCGHHGSAHDLRNRCLVEGCDCRCFSKIRQSLPIESPAPAPDPVCANCGHGQGHHMGKTEFCGKITRTYHDERSDETCDCRNFVPTAEPEPAPLDPVLDETIYEIVIESLRFNSPSGDEGFMTDELLETLRKNGYAIRANGQDGAR